MSKIHCTFMRSSPNRRRSYQLVTGNWCNDFGLYPAFWLFSHSYIARAQWLVILDTLIVINFKIYYITCDLPFLLKYINGTHKASVVVYKTAWRAYVRTTTTNMSEWNILSWGRDAMLACMSSVVPVTAPTGDLLGLPRHGADQSQPRDIATRAQPTLSLLQP